jgi:hypothetical protein
MKLKSVGDGLYGVKVEDVVVEERVRGEILLAGRRK